MAQPQGLWSADSLQLLTPSRTALPFKCGQRVLREVLGLRKMAVAKGMFFSGIPTSNGLARQWVKVLAISAQFL